MSTDTAQAALDVDSLSFDYGRVRALDDVSLRIEAGEFVALLGANGAGKSTFFSLVTGLYSAPRGDIRVKGHDLRRETLRALANMGVVFQKPTVDMDLSVLQNLRYAADLQGIARREAGLRIDEGLERHELVSFARRKVGSLSGGQRRRVELCRALLHRPALVLLDEPTVGLDLNSRADFVSHVKSLCRDQGTGVLWATHLMDEVAMDDTLYLLHKGRITGHGRLDQLLETHALDNLTDLFHRFAPRDVA